jgi:hypothetical protein
VPDLELIDSGGALAGSIAFLDRTALADDVD